MGSLRLSASLLYITIPGVIPTAMFCIKTENLSLDLQVVPVASLLFHEEILPDKAQKLYLEFRNLANLQNPIIVEKNHIVLDGNHRAFVFRALNFRYIPVCKIDYFHKRAELRYWFRLLANVKSIDQIKDAIDEIGGTLREVQAKKDLADFLKKNHFACGIQRGDYYGFVTLPEEKVSDVVDAYALIEIIQKRLTEQGAELRFVPCQQIQENDCRETMKDDEWVIWTPHMTKEMVVDAAKKGRLFAPKSTRHCIPARPLNVNVPTPWFKENISLEKINERFKRFLEGKKVRRFGPGQVIDGRYYGEEVFVFYEVGVRREKQDE